MAEPEQVFVVTSGCYSDYRIESVWLTLEEAQATAGEHDDVEVWPVGTRKRTLGGFYASGDINPTTGAVGREWTEEYAGYPPPKDRGARILAWPNRPGWEHISIRVTAETAERAGKVYTETKARVIAELSQGVPPEVIATDVYGAQDWVKTKP